MGVDYFQNGDVRSLHGMCQPLYEAKPSLWVRYYQL